MVMRTMRLEAPCTAQHRAKGYCRDLGAKRHAFTFMRRILSGLPEQRACPPSPLNLGSGLSSPSPRGGTTAKICF